MKSKPDFIFLATSGVQALCPYEPGKPLETLQREYGITEAIKLASNENPMGPSPRALESIRQLLDGLARYPDGNGFALKTALSEKHGIKPEQITLGNGSNDVLDFIGRAFLMPSHEVIFSQHAFALYALVTQAVGAKAVVIPAKDWGHDLEAMANAVSKATRIIFIANPNNPTGTWLKTSALKAFIHHIPSDVLIVLDEAYYEYASHPDMNAADYSSGMAWLEDYPNLIVTRTFSKAYGLAGLRVGYGVSHQEVADLLNRVRQPFNVNSLALAGAQAALTDDQHVEQAVQINITGMQQLTQAFNAMGLKYIPSVGNFICVEVGRNAPSVYEALLRQGVIVRPVASYEMPNHLRITVGTAEENQCLLDGLVV